MKKLHLKNKKKQKKKPDYQGFVALHDFFL
jgi:hypothetical protein